MSINPAVVRPLGLVLGVAADALIGDPDHWHPVAGFGQAAVILERKLYADNVVRGGTYVALSVGTTIAGGILLERMGRRYPLFGVLTTAVATWAVLGGTSLAREGALMAATLDRGDVTAARKRLPHLCARDPYVMDADDLARASVESLAENTSDAMVAPLLWGAVAGVPGLLGYRAANTLDAMVGYTSPRYLRFGRVAARLDDVVNLIPSRVTGLLTTAAAGTVGGSSRNAWQVLRRDGGRHPSPNAGRPEAATAGALGIQLGGRNSYSGKEEERPVLGNGHRPKSNDVRRAARLGRVVGIGGAALAVGFAVWRGYRHPRAAK